MVESLLKRLIYLGLRIKIWKHLSMKVRKIKGNIKINNVQKNLKNKHLKYWKSIDNLHSSDWLTIYYSINGIADYRYVSEQTYYSVVELTLNNPIFAEAYSDKNVYSKIINEKYLTPVYLRFINGVFYNSNYELLKLSNKEIVSLISNVNKDKLVVKKTIETGGGRGVTILNKSDDFFLNILKSDEPLSFLEENFGQNFVLQEFISQHKFFSKFNPSSVNTVRIYTYRSVVDEEIHVVSCVLRIGKKGVNVDNQASGGISCGVNVETGELGSFAVDKYGSKVYSSNDITFENVKLPMYIEMKQIAQEVGPTYQYHRLLGFDFVLTDKNEVKIIEVNNKNIEINFHQMNTGPLFGDYTDEILRYCKKNKASVKIDFEL